MSGGNMRISAIQKAVWRLAFDHDYAWVVVILLLLFEIAGGAAIIMRVRYTEIDWKAYMQEVQGVLDGNFHYPELRGGTGPLVYPAGFVWTFAALHYLHGADPSCCRLPPTDETESARCVSGGGDIRTAQLIFFAIYLCTTALVLDMYRRSRCVPPWALPLLCLSLRIHSLYTLRLFNDCIAMLLAYLMIYLFTRERLTLGVVLFSAAVSVKMNVLLFTPAIGILLLQAQGWKKSIMHAFLFLGVQISVALPFLQTDYVGYLSKAFELSRTFEQRWSVNWQFIPHHLFIGRTFATGLLCLHSALLLLFAQKRWCRQNQGLLRLLTGGRNNTSSGNRSRYPFDVNHVLDTVFTCNFIGVACSRTLHYQFYTWYYHALPFLLWRTNLPSVARLFLFIGIETGFNVFPASAVSSALLQSCHAVLLVAIWLAPLQPSMDVEKSAKVKEI